jgi:hypothetical protein
MAALTSTSILRPDYLSSTPCAIADDNIYAERDNFLKVLLLYRPWA